MNDNILDRDTAVFLAGVMTIVIACIMGLGTVVVLSAIAVLNLIMLASAETVRRLMGYGVVIDAVFGVAIAAIAVGTLGGFQVAMVAGLLYTLVRVELTKAWGSTRVSVNGKTTFLGIAKEAWSWLKAKVTGGTASFNVQWTEHQAPGGFEATNTGNVWTWLKSKAGVGHFTESSSWAKPAAYAAAGAASMLLLMQMSSYIVVTALLVAVGMAAWYMRPQFARA